ncbi:MAG: hypothetical protein Q3M30_09380 [Candidatus Electrothrix sp. Rat3]|nr:hypothetical protein [Candidatus Electrothrix rattekaaiensis]
MKKSVYLDTTIPSYLFDDRESIRMYIDVTGKWWNEERSNFDLWISEETFNELSEGDYPRKKEILRCAVESALLPPNNEIEQIVQVY